MAGRALIVGVGAGLSAAFARALAADGWQVALAARDPDKLAGLAEEIGASRHRVDVADPAAVEALFAAVGERDLVHFNPSRRVRGPIAELDPAAVAEALAISAYGGFLVGRAAARMMLPHGRGTILFTGASASIKGFPGSAAFAMGKFALRGLAQSMARELHPRGIHVLHVVVDGGIRSASRPVPADAPDSLLDPAAIATSLMAAIAQPRSAWSDEVTLRPWCEKF